MQAIEFNATVNNGVIPIPYQYQDAISNNVRVIVLTEEKPPQEPPKQKKKTFIISE